MPAIGWAGMKFCLMLSGTASMIFCFVLPRSTMVVFSPIPSNSLTILMMASTGMARNIMSHFCFICSSVKISCTRPSSIACFSCSLLRSIPLTQLIIFSFFRLRPSEPPMSPRPTIPIFINSPFKFILFKNKMCYYTALSSLLG